MLRTKLWQPVQARTYLTHYPPISSGDVRLERRLKKKIAVGKARPAIYYKFDQTVQLSDGSVVTRRSQTPKIELRFINDMRNNPLWNKSKTNLTQVNEKAAGRLNKFKQKYEAFETVDSSAEVKTKKTEEDDDALDLDDYLSLVGENVQEVASGGKLANAKKTKKKK